MKINKILYKIILTLMLLIICSTSICYARHDPGGGRGEPTDDSSSESSSSMLPSLDDDEYRPQIQLQEGESTLTIIETVLGFLIVIGICAVVIAIALIGFNSMLGSASEKALNQEKFVGIFIAACLITGGSIIAKFIISVAEKM